MFIYNQNRLEIHGSYSDSEQPSLIYINTSELVNPE